ncbi:MAG TPA: NAD(P)/FAD-dependent oxidoreductase [Chthoniobacteraceae bacterium]|nr:NAD(P)/FAD-dependent oxidoreductase [Chthoniobacteraceae bacterium]
MHRPRSSHEDCIFSNQAGTRPPKPPQNKAGCFRPPDAAHPTLRRLKPERTIAVIGGGAAGFFAAITAARQAREVGTPVRVVVLEKGAAFLSKVRISGGGRCNVTHACFEPRALAAHYPRGERALIGPFGRFSPRETIAWFEERGVRLKAEEDGRMFPVTDSSQTIIDALTDEARRLGVGLYTRCGVARLERRGQSGFRLHLTGRHPLGETLEADAVLLATGGSRSAGADHLAVSLGHRVEEPVPSLFTFHMECDWLRALAGVAVEPVEASVPGTGLLERGPLLATHWGASGPVILRLSAWGARELHARDYRFALQVNWLPGSRPEAITEEWQRRRASQPGALVARSPMKPIPARFWEALVAAAGIDPGTRWAIFSRDNRRRLLEQLTRSRFEVTGKSTNKAEFVTCGGVALREVAFRTMESRLAPGLYFAGEVLDIDGITGGFNFQAAWTTGWIAGCAMAEAVARS